MTMATRLAVMDKGQIVQIGTPHDVYEHPKNRFVADFIGSVNLFDGRLKEDFADHAVIESEDAGADLVTNRGIGQEVGHAVSLAVRPEKIHIVPPGGTLDLPNRLEGRIKDTAYLGNACVYHVVLASGKVLKITEPSLGRWADQPFARDQDVTIGWAADAAVLVAP